MLSGVVFATRRFMKIVVDGHSATAVMPSWRPAVQHNRFRS